jgi:hypothetical protein
MLAVKQNNVDIIDALLQRKDIKVNLQNWDGDTALMLAVKEKRVELVKALLQHPDINVNSKNEAKDTALMLAVEQKNVELIEALLQRTDININVIKYTELLEWALNNKHFTIAENLIQKPGGDTALMLAVQENNVELVKALLQRKNIKVNLQNWTVILH